VAIVLCTHHPEQVAQRREGQSLVVSQAGRTQHAKPALSRTHGDLGAKPRLADSSFAGEQQHPGLAAGAGRQQLLGRRQFALTVNQLRAGNVERQCVGHTSPRATRSCESNTGWV
jgi:hypothetical protein